MSGVIRAELMLLGMRGWADGPGPTAAGQRGISEPNKNKNQTSADQLWPKNTPIVSKYKRRI